MLQLAALCAYLRITHHYLAERRRYQFQNGGGEYTRKTGYFSIKKGGPPPTLSDSNALSALRVFS